MKTVGRSIRFLTAGLLLLMPMLASAECPLTEYSLSGKVVDPSGAPVPGARVTVRWEERASGEVSNQRVADQDGAFQIRIIFDTFSSRGFTGGENCDARLERVNVEITQTGFEPLTTSIDPSDAADTIPFVLVPN